MKYIIFCDLDDTLIKRHKYYINHQNLESIRNFVAKGNLFIISTGRWIDRITPLLNQLNEHEPNIKYVISLAGSYIYNVGNKTALYEQTIDNDVYKQLQDMLIDNKVMSLVYCEESFKTNCAFGLCTGWKSLLSEVNKNWKFIKVDNINLKDVFKVIIPFVRKKTKEKVLSLLKPFEHLLKIIPQKHYIEILDKNVDKGKAIKLLEKYLGFDYTQYCTISIGDSMNDYDMFQVTDRRYIVNPDSKNSPLNFMNLPIIENHDYLAVSKIINSLDQEKK